MMFGCPVLIHNDYPHQMPEFEAVHPGETGDFFERDNIASFANKMKDWFWKHEGTREKVRTDCMREIDNQWTSEFQMNVIRKIQEWFARPANYSYSENHYNLIERKLICEAYIEDHHGGFPTDYKFMCFHGKPFCVLACTGRESGNADYMPFTLDWKPLPEYTKNGDLYEIPKPKELDKMINIATKLADGLDLVRVDLYDTGTKIYFGEMTLTPAGAIFHNWSQKALDDMGAFYYKTMKK